MRILWFLFSVWIATATFSFAAGAPLPTEKFFEAPGSLTLDSLSGMYEKVRFDHDLHDSYASCVECHHHVTGKPPTDPGCNSCHRYGTTDSPVDCKSCHLVNRFSEESRSPQSTHTGYHIDIAGLIGAYHLKCVGCHLSITAGPTGCQDCHLRQDGRLSPSGRAVKGGRVTDK
ncbi:MAG: cytochrome c3 family protein [Desulfocapsaceae bacterium]